MKRIVEIRNMPTKKLRRLVAHLKQIHINQAADMPREKLIVALIEKRKK